MSLPEVTEAQRLTLKPGDRLVVRCERRVSVQEAETIKHRLRADLALPESMPVVVLDGGMSLEVAEAP